MRLKKRNKASDSSEKLQIKTIKKIESNGAIRSTDVLKISSKTFFRIFILYVLLLQSLCLLRKIIF